MIKTGRQKQKSAANLSISRANVQLALGRLSEEGRGRGGIQTLEIRRSRKFVVSNLNTKITMHADHPASGHRHSHRLTRKHRSKLWLLALQGPIPVNWRWPLQKHEQVSCAQLGCLNQWLTKNHHSWRSFWSWAAIRFHSACRCHASVLFDFPPIYYVPLLGSYRLHRSTKNRMRLPFERLQ